MAGHLGELSGISAAPSVLALHSIGLDSATIQAWIAQAQVENDGSLVFQRGIANLQRLLALLLPEKTVLLANYPNPFNPETWIPYQLSRVPTEVHFTYLCSERCIGSDVRFRTPTRGHVSSVRGHVRRIGMVKNEVGEPVASGMYFYSTHRRRFHCNAQNADKEVDN